MSVVLFTSVTMMSIHYKKKATWRQPEINLSDTSEFIMDWKHVQISYVYWMKGAIRDQKAYFSILWREYLCWYISSTESVSESESVWFKPSWPLTAWPLTLTHAHRGMRNMFLSLLLQRSLFVCFLFVQAYWMATRLP